MTDATQGLEAELSGVELPRRRWSDAKKRRIVAESYRGGESATAVARRHGVARRYRGVAVHQAPGAGPIPLAFNAGRAVSISAALLGYAGAFKVIHRNIEDALKATGIMEGDATLNKNAKSAALSAFEGAKQRFFGHLLTAMKCPSLNRCRR